MFMKPKILTYVPPSNRLRSKKKGKQYRRRRLPFITPDLK